MDDGAEDGAAQLDPNSPPVANRLVTEVAVHITCDYKNVKEHMRQLECSCMRPTRFVKVDSQSRGGG